jgi:hypothetical protein
MHGTTYLPLKLACTNKLVSSCIQDGRSFAPFLVGTRGGAEVALKSHRCAAAVSPTRIMWT